MNGLTLARLDADPVTWAAGLTWAQERPRAELVRILPVSSWRALGLGLAAQPPHAVCLRRWSDHGWIPVPDVTALYRERGTSESLVWQLAARLRATAAQQAGLPTPRTVQPIRGATVARLADGETIWAAREARIWCWGHETGVAAYALRLRREQLSDLLNKWEHDPVGAPLPLPIEAAHRFGRQWRVVLHPQRPPGRMLDF